MAKKKRTGHPPEVPVPVKKPEVSPIPDPEEPLHVPEVDPDAIPGEDPDEKPPYEVPPPGERP